MIKENQIGLDSAGVPSKGSGQTLRQRAEDIFKGKAVAMAENVEALSPEEVRQVLHELRVHQIELEMQNEELRRTQRELEASRARYFDLYDLAPVGYCTLSEAGLILEANLTAATLLGVARGALVKQLLTRFILKEDQYIFYQHRKQLLETHSTSSGQAGEPQACELRMVKKDGPAFWVYLAATAERDPDGALLYRVVMSDITERKQALVALQQAHDELEQRVVARTEELRQANEELRADITERKQAEEQLVNYHTQMTTIFNSLDAFVYAADMDSYEVFFINEYGRRHWGDIVGKRCWETIQVGQNGPCPFCTNDRLLNPDGSSSGVYHWEFQNTRNKRWYDCRDRSVKWVDGRIVRLEIATDITERKLMEKSLIEKVQQLHETRDMLIQFEKEAAVGRLAAGVAHELLNPASIISSRLQFIEDETLTDQVREGVKICREQLQRIAKISQDLHQSSTIQPRRHVSGDLRDVIELSLKMTESRIQEDKVLAVYQPSPTIIPVKMEKDSMTKVMVHLILNACDALLNTNQKRLIITVQYPIATDKPSSVLLIVADNGCSVSEGDMNRIFDPFFTTKDPGKGTGLGLSICKNIISEHRGTIHVENNDMGGASFIFELPLDHP